MELVLLIVSSLARASARRRAKAARMRTAEAVPMPTTPGEVESAVTAELLAGRLDPELYRDCMAAIAATTSREA